MAPSKGGRRSAQEKKAGKQHLVTSIGKSRNTRPKNKSKRLSYKKYNRQGK
jgi:hypothetical protein